MPKQKNQHYVPKCHLKPFSVDAQGRAINLFNIAKALTIPNAPVKGQCAKDYLHGTDLRLEDALGKIESHYGQIVHPLASQTSIAASNMSFLCSFAYLQYHRTAMALQRKRDADLDIQDVVYAGTPDSPPEIDLSDRALIQESIESFRGLRHFVDDLKCCLVRNKTQRDFVTSDDPAILTNKFYMQRLNRCDFGIASSGVMLVLPLTPRFLLLCYDSGVYRDRHYESGNVYIAGSLSGRVIKIGTAKNMGGYSRRNTARWTPHLPPRSRPAAFSKYRPSGSPPL